MTATVHALPIEPRARATRVEYDSRDGEWRLTLSEDPDATGYVRPGTLPQHVVDALNTLTRD